LIFGLACLTSAFSAGLNQLVAWRFITGVGLGAAMPNAMMNEYCPEARRATLTNAMFCGFPLGAAFGGFIAAWMIPYFGWRSVLILGGIAPLVLGGLIIFLLPESVRYMVAKNYPAERIREALRRVQPAATKFPLAMTGVSEATEELVQARNSIGVVLSRELLVGSVMLWLAYFMGLVIFYALVNWMPVLLKDAGVTPGTAALVSALFPLGGFGAILSGWLMDRFNRNVIIAACFALTVAAVYAIGQSTGHIVPADAGGSRGRNNHEYGSIVVAYSCRRVLSDERARDRRRLDDGHREVRRHCRSFLVAELSRRNLSFSQIFMIVAISGLLAAIALVIKQFAHPETRLDYDVTRGEVLGH
jgi:AAHS family 4-hydroxybenzoate transporter-like MFS transporter